MNLLTKNVTTSIIWQLVVLLICNIIGIVCGILKLCYDLKLDCEVHI